MPSHVKSFSSPRYGKRRIKTDHRKPSTTIRKSLDRHNVNQCPNNLDLSQIDDDFGPATKYQPPALPLILANQTCFATNAHPTRHVIKGPTKDFIKDTNGLTGIRQDDPRPWTGQRHIPQLQHLPCDSDGHVRLGALLERCWFSTSGAHAVKDRHESERHNHASSQATEKRELAIGLDSPQVLDKSQKGNETCERALDARMPVDSPTRGKQSP